MDINIKVDKLFEDREEDQNLPVFSAVLAIDGNAVFVARADSAEKAKDMVERMSNSVKWHVVRGKQALNSPVRQTER